TSRNQELKQIEIFTLNGTLIYTGKPENKISAYQVNATGLPNGIYLLRLTSHSLSKTLKITIH
ncbi:MAG: T9SS type A sorting domain-containing protein, partial [Bacteroidetes bacterium]